MEMGLDELINVRTNPNLFSQNSQGCQVDRLISGHVDGRIILFRFVTCGCFPGGIFEIAFPLRQAWSRCLMIIEYHGSAMNKRIFEVARTTYGKRVFCSNHVSVSVCVGIVSFAIKSDPLPILKSFLTKCFLPLRSLVTFSAFGCIWWFNNLLIDYCLRTCQQFHPMMRPNVIHMHVFWWNKHILF